MTKTNVFENTRQVKSNAESLLKKVKSLAIDTEKHLTVVNSLLIQRQEIEAYAKTAYEKSQTESLAATDKGPEVETEIFDKEALNESISMQNKSDDNQILVVTSAAETIVQAIFKPETESKIEIKTEETKKVSRETQIQSSVGVIKQAQTDEVQQPVQKPTSLSRQSSSQITRTNEIKRTEGRMNSSATAVSSTRQDTVNKTDRKSDSIDSKSKTVVHKDTEKPLESIDKSFKPRVDKPSEKKAPDRQPITKNIDSGRQLQRNVAGKRNVDLVEKFFSDPELKEREKKEKEEYIKSTSPKALPQSTKAKTRQDKKDLWLEKESDSIISISKFKGGKGKGIPLRINNDNSTSTVERKKNITMGDYIIVKDLSEKIGVQASEIIKSLMKLGVMVTINQEIDYDTAMLVSSEFSILLEKKTTKTFEQVMADENYTDSEEFLITRPPVVTVMGHVDHGKTSLLDAIRNARVTEQEAGGITQHIGAYTVDMLDKQITFLDTPGHEAFTTMRARGAQVTDIAVLVVAADDGIMPQTVEAINHAKAAKVPIIVAINKIDLPDANPDRVAQQLMEHGLVAEKWGGETITVPISALKKQGIDVLLEMIILVSEMQDLKANPNRLAKGIVIEAQLDRGRGPVATVLVQNGTLNIGDAIVAGTSYGRVRAMLDYKGNRIKQAGPSMPVEVLGLSDVPEAGDMIQAVKDDRLAKQVAEERFSKIRDLLQKSVVKTSLDDLFGNVKEGEIKDLNIIIKADVQGSVEAMKNALERISTEKVKIKIIHVGVGAVSESDVMLATASNAIIVAFNVRASASASDLAQTENIDIRTYRIIYNAIEDIQLAVKGMLDPEYKENRIGHAVVRAIFKVSGMGNVAGCLISDGKIIRNADIRIIRDGIIVHEGKISSLKRFKDDVREVTAGYECGLTISNFNDIKENDILEAFMMEET